MSGVRAVLSTAIVSMLCFGCSGAGGAPLFTTMNKPPPPPGRAASPMGSTDTGAITSGPTGSIAPGTSMDEPPPELVQPTRVTTRPVDTRDSTSPNRPAPAGDPLAVRPASPPIDRIEVTPGAPGDAPLANDHEITQGVRVALDRDENLSPAARNVLVTTRRGEVTLTGSVPTENERVRIDEAARSVPGVVRVENHLRVAP